MGTRAFLTQNKDAEAFQMAQQCLDVARKSFASTDAEDKRWQGLVLSYSVAALVQHAACELETAGESFEGVVSLLNHKDERAGPVRPRDALVSPALKQAAAFRLAERRTEEAGQLAARAVTAGRQAAEAGQGSTNPLLSPLALGEAVVDATLQQAQAAIDAKAWEHAESLLGEALEAVEALSAGSGAGSHVRVAFVLLPLAGVYARTGRATLAEGLYREVGKLLRLSPSTAEAVTLQEVHSSTGALAAWRYAQLLTALPKREREAAAWHQLATDLYDDAPLRMVLEPATVFGSLDVLKGQGTAGYGVVLDLMSRRALPRVAPAPPPLADK